MQHDATAGLLDRGDDRFEVERDEGAQVNHLGVGAGVLGRRQCDMDHGACLLYTSRCV